MHTRQVLKQTWLTRTQWLAKNTQSEGTSHHNDVNHSTKIKGGRGNDSKIHMSISGIKSKKHLWSLRENCGSSCKTDLYRAKYGKSQKSRICIKPGAFIIIYTGSLQKTSVISWPSSSEWCSITKQGKNHKSTKSKTNQWKKNQQQQEQVTTNQFGGSIMAECVSSKRKGTSV